MTPLRRAETLLVQIEEKKRLVAETFVDIGIALLEIQRHELWRALGYSNLSEMLVARGVIGRSQAFKLMAVARGLPRKQALSLGAEKAYALVRYARATHVARPAEVVTHGIVVRGKRRPLGEVTTKDIEKETRHATHAAHAHAVDPEEEEAIAAAARFRAELARRGVRAEVHVSPTREAFVCDVRIAPHDLDRVLGS